MCRDNTEWQGDGWGVGWMIEGGGWKIEKSLKPIWKDTDALHNITPSDVIMVHARGASFPYQKGDISYNQPYVDGDLCFVFNGELYGVKIKADGKIGAQKIFSLLKKNIQTGESAVRSLEMTRDLLLQNSRSILGCNIAFYNNGWLYATCNYTDKKNYYTVRYYSDDNLSIICSEKIGSYKWIDMEKGETIQL